MTAPAVPHHRYNDGVAAWQPSVTAPLVARAQAGDQTAKGELYQRYRPVVFRFVFSRIQHRQTAEDLCGDTWVRAFRSLHNYQDQGKDFGAWLVTIARNIVADHFKSSAVRTRYTLADDELQFAIHERIDASPEGNPAQSIADHFVNLTVLSAFKDLSPGQRECLTLRFLRDLTTSETAQAMGVSEQVVKSLQYRATRALVRLLPRGFHEGIRG